MKDEIIVENLKKIYKVPIRSHGLLPALKSLISPKYEKNIAVDDINFRIKSGETVGFIGPNGAGKTTTLKMLSGVLNPSSGQIEVAGFTPYKRKTEFLKSISLIMGNKTQLNWQITVLDSFHIIKEIYDVPNHEFKERLDKIAELLDIEKLFTKMARNLSLGERAKCEFAAALLYKPAILFLDEPTLGMDVSIQIKLRNFIKSYCVENNTTVLLTSHYMADISSLCSRVILINKGKLVFDGNLTTLANKLSVFKLLKIHVNADYDLNNILNTIGDIQIVAKSDNRYTLRIKKENTIYVATALMNKLPIIDLTIEDPPIEAVIDQVYQKGLVSI